MTIIDIKHLVMNVGRRIDKEICLVWWSWNPVDYLLICGGSDTHVNQNVDGSIPGSVAHIEGRFYT